MLDMPGRHVQLAALTGIGHCAAALQRGDKIDAAIEAFLSTAYPGDQELRAWAQGLLGPGEP